VPNRLELPKIPSKIPRSRRGDLGEANPFVPPTRLREPGVKTDDDHEISRGEEDLGFVRSALDKLALS
jgi:hypothetical protein